MSMIERAKDEGIGWSCPDCGTFYFCIGSMRFCPACADKVKELERVWWNNKRVGMRSITDDIVAKALGK